MEQPGPAEFVCRYKNVCKRCHANVTIRRHASAVALVDALQRAKLSAKKIREDRPRLLLSGFAVFAAALLHEDIAILTASFFVAQRELPLATALAFLFAGVMINNLAIYGLGALARRLPGARRGLIGKRVERIGRELKARAVPAVLFCRLTPGLLLLTFIGCGRFGVPFFFPLCASRSRGCGRLRFGDADRGRPVG